MLVYQTVCLVQFGLVVGAEVRLGHHNAASVLKGAEGLPSCLAVQVWAVCCRTHCTAFVRLDGIMTG